MESPTTTAARARPSAPTASATRICDASSNTTRSNWPAAAGKNRATESGDTSTHGMTAVISSPYCASSCAHAEPAALLGQLPLQRADLAEPGRRVERPRRRAPRAGSAAVRCSRTARDAAVNRRIAFSCTCASNSVEPGRVQPLRHRRRGQPAVEGADGVVGRVPRR